MEAKEAESLLKGQVQVWQHMFGFVDSMSLKCAVELRIADIINSHGCPMTLSQISSSIDSPSPDTSYLSRILRFLVHKHIFTAHPAVDGTGEIQYGLNQTSRWLLHDSELTLAPMITLENTEWMLAPLRYLSQCVKEGGICFKKAHGVETWDFASQNPTFNKILNDGMACTAKIVMREFLLQHKDGFESIRSLVDVGGGTGCVMAEIVKSNPHIKGINFDLPHVIATAPEYHGVSHVSGDMFDVIPRADAIFMKRILHDWGDEDCIKILKSCRKAIPDKLGKVIILDIVLEVDQEKIFEEMRFVFDILMIAHTTRGKERTELEWKHILEKGGFSSYKISKIKAMPSIIEAYP